MEKAIYHNIYDNLRKEILSEKYKKGEKIQSERKLMEKYGVSRTTIRQALFYLQQDGYIYKIQGKGNFVSSKLINQNLNKFYSFSNEVNKAGKTPTSVLISYKMQDCDSRLSEIFGINEGSKLYNIKRLRLIDGSPAMLEETFIPEYRFKNFPVDDLNNIQMYEIFKEKYNVSFSSAQERFKPIKAETKEDIKHLNIKKNDIVIEIVRKTYELNKVIEYTISHVKNDVFSYTVNLNL
ncbi:GntR family transcriptional regulator [Oceanivirga miroungae]|uniref:GntR family transcriptional regulator n=1 Tax=Oceanivirga miroungae TaxID=1130046 RepID=A0A6I8M6I8_9FUSO|nr:GntR family transcriptional regulator [Oceanivirga miroungae]VWL85066.1 GntR family transcriptional regulator [Oceanivirga miroungae]